MAAVTIKRTGLLLALTAALLAAALILIGQAGADDGAPLPAPEGLRVTAERGSLDVALDWDDVSGADYYRVRWRPAGPDSKLNDGVQVQSSNAVITVARYGEWVARVQACDDAGCGAPAAKKFKVRRPRAVPDITPLPTATPTPLPTSTPTPLPTATPTPLPTSTPTPEPTATSTPSPTSTPAPGTLRVSVTASAATLQVNQPVSLTASVSNAPPNSNPSYVWELNNGGGWFPQGAGPTLSYLAGSPESWSFRVTVTYGSGDSATSGPITVTWVEIPPTPTATSIPEPTATPTPEPTATPIPDPTATPTPAPSLPIPAKPAGLSVSAAPGSLEVSVDWDDVSGASYYWLRWREAGSGSELNEGVAVLPSEAVITVAGYGEWVARVQACNDASCGAPAVSKFSVEQAPVIPGQPENLEVIAEPGSKALLVTWDEVEGATSYKMRWREDGGEFDTADAATISGTPIWSITVSDYGRWEVQVQGCNDSGCGPEAAATAEVVRAASLSLERAVDSEGNVRSRSVTANWDPVAGAASYTLSWHRFGDDSQANAQAQSAADARQSRAVSAASLSSGQDADDQTSNQRTFGAEETGTDLTLPDDGAYRAEFRALSDDGDLIAMAHGHINQAPGQPDTAPPRLVWGEMDGDRMRLYFSEPLNESVVGGYFHPSVQYANCNCKSGGFTRGATEISGNRVTVNLNGNVTAVEGLKAFVSYWAYPSDTSLQDIAGNKVWTPDVAYDGRRGTWPISLYNITGRPYVAPLVHDSRFGPYGVAISSDAGDDRFYEDGDIITVKLTFSESVDVTGTPRLKIDLDPATGGERWADYSAGSGTRMLEFSYTVADGDSAGQGVAVPANTLELNGGTIRATWARGVEDARLGHAGLRHNPAHRVVTPGSAAPILQSASVTGTALTLTFSEALGAAASLSNDAFTMKKTPQDGSEQDVSLSGSPSISGSVVALTLASAVLDTDEWLKVSYAKPATGANNKLVDVGGAEAADFTDDWVTNTLDTTQPTLVRGEIDGDVITLYFSEPLDEDSMSVTVGDHFRIEWGFDSYPPPDGQCPFGSGPIKHSTSLNPREVYVSGNTVVIVGLKKWENYRAIRNWTVVSLIYIADITVAQRLRDLAGNTVSTPIHSGYNKYETRYIDLDNVTQLPYPKSAAVNGSRLTLTFNAPMDGAWKPAASAFTVKVGGSAVSLSSSNPVGISGDTVTLTLAAAVASTDTVTVSYAKPDSSPLRNVVCEYAPSFTDESVTNSTP